MYPGVVLMLPVDDPVTLPHMTETFYSQPKKSENNLHDIM